MQALLQLQSCKGVIRKVFKLYIVNKGSYNISGQYW